MGEPPHLVARARPVGQSRVVAEVDEVLVRQGHETLVQDRQSSDTRVEDTDGPGIRHGAIVGSGYPAAS